MSGRSTVSGTLGHEVEFEFVEGAGAAGGFVATGQVRGVILKHLANRDVDAAASLLASSAPEIGDLILDEDAPTTSQALRQAIAEMFFRARDFARAGRAALLIGNPAQAAPFFERSYQFARAAELYEQAGDLERAADMFERELKFEKAAALFEKVDRFERAAESWEKAGEHYRAGQIWTHVRRLDRAVDVLERTSRKHARWPSAMLLLGRILEGAGQRDQAYARYVEVVKSGPIDAERLGVWERLGELYVGAGEAKAARKVLGEVLRLQPTRERAALALAKIPPDGARPAPAAADRPRNEARPAESPLVSSPPSAPAPGALAPLVLPKIGAPAPSISHAPSLDPFAGPSLPPPPEAARVTSVQPDVDTLRNLPLFSELSLDQIRALHMLGQRRTYDAGATLIEQDREAEHVLVVLAGKVIVSHAIDGREVRLAELGYGAAIGEMALVDHGPTSATVRAKDAVTLFRWPIAELRHHLESDERVAARILRVLSRTLSVRLRETNRRVPR